MVLLDRNFREWAHALRVVVGILEFLLLPMGWIHGVGKFPTFSNVFINLLYALLASHFIEFSLINSKKRSLVKMN